MIKQVISYRFGKQVRLLALAALFLLPATGWGQGQNLGGCYYIKNNDETTSTFYLCPSEPCDLVYATDQPYLTTYPHTGTDRSVWYLTSKMVENVEYYYIVHVSEAKYLTFNEQMGTGGTGTYNYPDSRIRVHLQSDPDDSSDRKSLFRLRYTSGSDNDYYTISPKSDDGKSLNPAGNNTDSYCGTELMTPTGRLRLTLSISQ